VPILRTRRRTAAQAQPESKAPTFGESGERRWPFSRQLKHAIRVQFSEDVDTFNRADSLQRILYLLALVMRVLTFVLTFLPFLAIFALVLDRKLGTHSGSWLWGGFEALTGYHLKSDWLGVLVAVLGLFVLRMAIRLIFNLVAQLYVERLSYTVSQQYGEIRHDVTANCREIGNRPTSGNWSATAKRHAKLALTGLKRAEYLDRYSTTVFWKIEDGFRAIETFFAALKTLTFSAVAFMAFHADFLAHPAEHLRYWPPMSAVGITLLFAIVAYFGWFYLGRSNNDFLTKTFSGIIDTHGADPYEEIADVVRARVADIESRDKTSNQAGAAPGPQTSH
jgi:hypothetical protein